MENANAVLKENCLFQDSDQSNSQEMVELGGKLHFLANIWAVSTFQLFRGQLDQSRFVHSPKTNFPAFEICFPPMLHILQGNALACLIIDGQEGHLKSLRRAVELQSGVRWLKDCQYFAIFYHGLSIFWKILEFFLWLTIFWQILKYLFTNCQYFDRFQIIYQLQQDYSALFSGCHTFWGMNKSLDSVRFCNFAFSQLSAL